ncbi:DUF6559 family protein [Photobacterium gaetbulicola]|nr:DUF6559 family protein [Photobacterium gaetbulicola]
MMFVFTQLFKRRTIRKYIKTLSPMLVTSYGPREAYTNGQIAAVLAQSGLSRRYKHYAYALFGDQYPDLHQELANGLFTGSAFNALQIIDMARPSHWKGGTNTDDFSNRHGQNSRY